MAESYARSEVTAHPAIGTRLICSLRHATDLPQEAPTKAPPTNPTDLLVIAGKVAAVVDVGVAVAAVVGVAVAVAAYLAASLRFHRAVGAAPVRIALRAVYATTNETDLPQEALTKAPPNPAHQPQTPARPSPTSARLIRCLLVVLVIAGKVAAVVDVGVGVAVVGVGVAVATHLAASLSFRLAMGAAPAPVLPNRALLPPGLAAGAATTLL